MNIHKLVENGDVAGIRAYMDEHGLKLDGNRLVPKDEAAKSNLKYQAEFWGQRQQARKILLNSLN